MSDQDRQKFLDNYHNVVDDVYRYARFKLGNREEAEDATAETFLRLLSRHQSLSEIENLKVFTIGIARNVIYEIYRTESRQAASLDNIPADLESALAENTMEQTAINDSLIDLVKKHMSELDEASAEVLILRVWEEWPFADIAALLSEKETTVKLRFYRAVEKLKQQVSKEDKKLLSIGFPSLLFAVLATSNSGEYALPVSFIQKINNLFNSQFTNLPMNDVTPIASTPQAPIAAGASKSLITSRGFWLGLAGGIACTAVVTAAIIVGLQAARSNSNTSNANSSTASVSTASSSTSSTATSTTSSTTSTGIVLSQKCTNSDLGVTVSVPADWSCTYAPKGSVTPRTTAKGDIFTLELSQMGDLSCPTCTWTTFYEGNRLIIYKLVKSNYGEIGGGGSDSHGPWVQIHYPDIESTVLTPAQYELITAILKNMTF